MSRKWRSAQDSFSLHRLGTINTVVYFTTWTLRTARVVLARTYTPIRLVIQVELALSPSRVRRHKFTGCAVTAQNAELQQAMPLRTRTKTRTLAPPSRVR